MWGKTAVVVKRLRNALVRLAVTRRFWIAIGAFVLAVAAIVWLVQVFQFRDYRSTQTQRQAHYDSVKQADPRSGKASDRADYQLELAAAAETAADYDGAIRAFEQYEKIVAEQKEPAAYLSLARYYCRKDDTASAVRALQAGKAAAGADEAITASLVAAHEQIDKKGCQAWVAVFDRQ